MNLKVQLEHLPLIHIGCGNVRRKREYFGHLLHIHLSTVLGRPSMYIYEEIIKKKGS